MFALNKRNSRHWTQRARGASIEILAVVTGFLCVIWAASEVSAADVYKCLCNNGPMTNADVLGHQECQHGPEQDADCVWYEMDNGVGFGAGCGQAAGALPTGATLAALKAQLIALGYDPAVVNGAGFAGLFDGTCDCFKCVYNTTQAVAGNNQNSPCEALIYLYGAFCQKDQTGDCDLNPPVAGKVRESKGGALKPGKTSCAGIGGAGGGSTTMNYCGLGTWIGGNQLTGYTGTTCVDDGTNCTTTGAFRNEVQGQVATCKTP